ncbi:hypothetical protein [Albibacterium bauzanense]|uniref:HEAT repeat domain-containing protein n=1 Tax=Albibacterium bauzanense TaxID=653929 RepID=A0A4R1LQN2_9SPHI|nr:hypothetical protein [Albibacterium bauzanense]TCK80614.1 hypothetical protein C8N28_2357 [Albibacterium bauzanense]
MNIKERLSQRINMDDMQEIIYRIQDNGLKKQELFSLLFDPNDKVAFQAAWVMSHFSLKENEWLFCKQDEMIDEVLICQHTGKRRLILTLLYKQPLVSLLRVDFLDFCLERMITKKEPSGIQSLCMKIAFELCRSSSELMQEFKAALEMMEGESSPAIHVARKNILKAMQRESL